MADETDGKAAVAAEENEMEADGGDAKDLKVDIEKANESVVKEEDEEDDRPMSPKRGTTEANKMVEKIGKEEEQAIKKAKMTQKQKLKALRDKQNAALAKSGKASVEAKLAFLQRQTEVFSRFMDKDEDDSKKKKKKKGGGRTRMTEEEEDAELMTASMQNQRLTRLTVQPSCIKFGTMRPYQIEGLNWMINLYEQGINGILADEMGLGKTLQSISLLGYLKHDRGVSGPHIVIVPKSVLGNWLREFKRWCPSLRVIKVHGTKEERAKQIQQDMRPGEFDVVVTTYEIVRIERSAFLKYSWRYLLMDEAHSIKNETSRLAITVRELDTQFRLLITGTPLQNNLRELWALLNFLLPEVFGNAESFEEYFKMDTLAEESVVSKLHSLLRPFMIRRLKADVEKALPPKREIKLYTGMSEMQTYWYKKTLSRDVAALNQLGGPERTRLLNILMQLRKVCNHPYLFQGAEPGPPYFDGPHLWENAGKMIMLDKLLTRLKKNGDRVLVFSQMTRLLDILEDYMRFKGYEYCRIDGQTHQDDRDKFMDEYNAPESSKFVFLLSTRAGGLGINLQTANVVILYDSDWNPQMDLQAQDRAHRIGQKREVTVFRFITEGTVEEKIVERAEKKLYLDAVVVQQGRLQQSNKSLNKQELMTMVKFGADAIFKSEGATVTDEDIDLILQKGEAKTEEDKKRYQDDAQHNLLNFRLDTDESSGTFMFEGKDYSGARAGNFINLPTRARKRNYDVNEYYRDALSNKDSGKSKKEPRMPKGITMHDFQFFNKERVEEIEKHEHDLIAKRRAHMHLIKEARNKERRSGRSKFGEEEDENADEQELAQKAKEELEALEAKLPEFELSQELQDEKEKLIDEAFGNWNRRDFRAYTSACERHGRKDKEAIAEEVSEVTQKPKEEVMAYHAVFWKRYEEIQDWEKLIERIEKGEHKLARKVAIKEALAQKVDRTKNPWQTLAINYGSNKGKTFTEEEDRFLVCMMNRIGYGAWDQMKQEIRKAWNFRFDWFFKSRNAAELQRRCDTLVRLIEKENEELKNKSSKGSATSKRPRPSTSSKVSASASKKKRKKTK